jgi:phospholipase/carboxylesterase
MYRTPSLTQTLVPSSTTLAPHWTGKHRPRVTKRRDAILPHCLFSPIHYEPGYAYPLIVWLHGPESSELELQQVMPMVSLRNYVGVAPRGTSRTSKTERLYTWRQTANDVADACQRVVDCIDLARDQYNIHVDRTFVAGCGEGGTMALRVGMEHPELFAGAISLGGRVPRGGNAFRRINSARRLPLMLSVAPTEGQYSNQQIKDDLRLLHSGGFPLSLQLYAGKDEPLVEDMFWDLDAWVMEQFCPTAVTAS